MEWAFSLCRSYAGFIIKEDDVEENVMFVGLQVMPVVAGVAVFLLVQMVYGEIRQDGRVLATYREIYGLLREKQKDSDRYQRLERWMTQNGAVFHYGQRITPAKYLVVRMVFALVGVWVMVPISAGGGILVGALLFLLPNWLLTYLNSKDNEKMLPELKLVYNAMELQIKAGVYVTDALAECYGSVRDRRLRAALLDLAGDIVMRADIEEALGRFQGKFDNRYVDSLCITILQALESGQAVELLGDISEQIKDMEQALLERKKAALDRSLTFYQLAVLAAVLGIALYACVTRLLGAAAQL